MLYSLRCRRRALSRAPFHARRTIRHVDRIIVLHQGRVVEDGSHEELLARHDYYYRLYQLQFAGQGLATAAGIPRG